MAAYTDRWVTCWSASGCNSCVTPGLSCGVLTASLICHIEYQAAPGWQSLFNNLCHLHFQQILLFFYSSFYYFTAFLQHIYVWAYKIGLDNKSQKHGFGIVKVQEFIKNINL